VSTYIDGVKTKDTHEVVSSFVLDGVGTETSSALQIGTDPDNMTYPTHLSMYDKDSRKWLVYENIDVSNTGKYQYLLLDNLGTTKLGFDEYNSSANVTRSILPENRSPFTDGIYNEVLASKEVKQPEPKVQTTNPLKFNETFTEYLGEPSNDNTYSKTDILSALDKIANSNSKYKSLSELIMKNTDVFDGKLKITLGQDIGRGSTTYDEVTGLAISIDINPDLFFEKDTNSDAFIEEFEEVLLHESLHAVLGKYVNIYSNADKRSTLPTMVKQYFDKVDGVRNNIVENLDSYDKELGLSTTEFEQFKKDYRLRINMTQEKIDKYAGLINTNEFVSYIMTSPQFQEQLSQMKDEQGRNILEQVIDWFTKIVKDLMLIEDIDGAKDSKLAESMNDVIKLLDEIAIEEQRAKDSTLQILETTQALRQQKDYIKKRQVKLKALGIPVNVWEGLNNIDTTYTSETILTTSEVNKAGGMIKKYSSDTESDVLKTEAKWINENQPYSNKIISLYLSMEESEGHTMQEFANVILDKENVYILEDTRQLSLFSDDVGTESLSEKGVKCVMNQQTNHHSQ